jgi:threonine synthase
MSQSAKYVSTRGADAEQPKSFCEILLAGLATDGGLYLPQAYPSLSADELAVMRTLSYPELAFNIISRFVDDIPAAALNDIIDRTYTAETFGSEEITPLVTLSPGLHLLKCSNGPTLAFKDIAMQWLGNLFEYVLAQDERELNILGATSGDTGSAAEHAMKSKRGIRVFMLSPQGKMSPFQTAQMFSIQDSNIYNFAVEGVFDDCQDMVKAVSNDLNFKAQYKIGAVNSINWGRIVAQIVYYFKGYFAATSSNQEKVSFSVPSGNFGNVLAGHVARMMGLPIRQLIVATNENDVLDEFFRSGKYRPRTSANTQQTSSPSMDISKASNFERFLYDLVWRDPAVVRELMLKVDAEGGFDLASCDQLWGRVPAFGFVSARSTHADRVATIRQVYQQYGVEVDPHTADGIKAGRQCHDGAVPLICLETALPAKFESTMLESLGQMPTRPAAYDGIEKLPQRFAVLTTSVDRLKDTIAKSCQS